MTQIETTQNTLGKATRKLIKELCPTAKTVSKVGKNYVIRDENGKRVATWHNRLLKTGLIVIND